MVGKLLSELPEMLQKNLFDICKILLILDELVCFHVLLVGHESFLYQLLGLITEFFEDTGGPIKLPNYSHFLELLEFYGYLAQ